MGNRCIGGVIVVNLKAKFLHYKVYLKPSVILRSLPKIFVFLIKIKNIKFKLN